MQLWQGRHHVYWQTDTHLPDWVCVFLGEKDLVPQLVEETVLFSEYWPGSQEFFQRKGCRIPRNTIASQGMCLHLTCK